MYLLTLISRLLYLMISGSESACRGFENNLLSKKVITQNKISQKLELAWLQDPFFRIWGGFVTRFHDFCCPVDWLVIRWLFRATLPGNRLGGRWRSIHGLNYNNSRISEIDSRNPETDTGSLELSWKYIWYWIHWNTGLQSVRRSLAWWPSQARRIYNGFPDLFAEVHFV